MAFVPHKYMPQEMPDPELRETFAARQHTLDYLVQSMRAQIDASTLTSFLITGPRGAGKTTLVLRLAGEIKTDPALAAAWLSVRFPEELPGIESLRDLLAAALRLLADKGIASAADYVERVDKERDDERSLELAIAGLRHVTQEEQRRLVLFVENLDLVFDSGIDKATQHTLRRLLMVDPFMMVIGTAVTFGSYVRTFSAIQKYDHALFNYFCQVPLERLTDDQVHELLGRRADFDRNQRFKRDYDRHKAKIQAISHLTGGNPRLLLMLYEVLSARDMTSVVQTLRQLIDELTPLLKSIVESLPPQQAKVIDALMRAGGSATPRDLVFSTRLSLNAVTTQLGRLKAAQMVEVKGGGKGRTAYYVVPDRLFSTWYQMRYLRPHRRRIELFVEVLQTWFEAEERLTRLQSLAADTTKDGLPLNAAIMSEYLAASLHATPFRETARDLAVRSWLRLDNLREAALSLAELDGVDLADRSEYESAAYAGLSRWSDQHRELSTAVAASTAALSRDPNNSIRLARHGILLAESGNLKGALDCLDQVVMADESLPVIAALAFLSRGFVKRLAGDNIGEITDYSAVLQLAGAPIHDVAWALVSRGAAKARAGDITGAIADYTAVVQLAGAPVEHLAVALVNRGLAKGQTGDTAGETADYTTVVQLAGAPVVELAKALFCRAVVEETTGDTAAAVADYTAVIDLPGAPVNQVAKALFNRGVRNGKLGDPAGEIADCTAVVQLARVPVDQVALALLNRGVAKMMTGDTTGGIDDYTTVVQFAGAPARVVTMALYGRGTIKSVMGDAPGAIEDLLAALQANAGPVEIRGDAGAQSLVCASRSDDSQLVDSVINAMVTAVQSDGMPPEDRRSFMLAFLNNAASPPTSVAWPRAWRALSEAGLGDVNETLQFFEPVVRLLEGADPSILNGLPPEQREFVEHVLRRFDDSSTPAKQ